VKERAIDQKCLSCGAPLLFNPTVGKWKCEHCRSEFNLEDIEKHNAKKNIKQNSTKTAEIQDDTVYINYKCKNCGAEIIADEQTASTFCVYCGNTAILKHKLSGKFAPSKIIPFKKDKKTAIEAFKGLNKGRPLMPKFFNDQKNIEKISGVYIPFWLYDINVAGGMNISATNIKTWTSGDYTYKKVDVYSIEKEATMDFERIPVDGSTRFSNDVMNSIEPFDYSEMVDYNHAYLSGFLAEKYDVDGNVAFEEASKRAFNSTNDEVLKSAGHYTTKTVTNNTLTPKETKKEYVLLPVWMINVKYKEKFHIFAMNAQTGEIIGDIPVHVPSLIKYCVIVFFSVFLIVLLITYIVYKFGGA